MGMTGPFSCCAMAISSAVESPFLGLMGIRTGSVWKSGHLVLNCEIEICHQLRCSNKPLEKSIDKGDNPVCHLQLSVHGVYSKSHVPWDWCMKWVVNFI